MAVQKASSALVARGGKAAAGVVEQLRCPRRVSGEQGDEARGLDEESLGIAVEPGDECLALLEQPGGRVDVALHDRPQAGRAQRAHPDARVSGATLQDPVEPRPAPLEAALHESELQQVGTRPQSPVGAFRINRGHGERLGQVAEVPAEPAYPVDLTGTEPVLVCLGEQPEVEVRVPVAHLGFPADTGELGAAPVPDRGQHPVAVPRRVAARDHHGLLHQRREDLLDRLRILGAGAHRFRCVELEPVDEDGCLGPQQSLRGRAEVEAPFDARRHGLVSERGDAAALAQQLPPVGQVRVQLGGRERPETRRRELDGERDALQLAADRGHSGAVVLGEGEVGDDRPGPIEEELDGVVLLERLRPCRDAGYDERRDRVLHLPMDAQRLPAGRQDAHTRARAEQGVGHHGRHVDDVLAVVQHKQHVPRPQVLDRGDRRRLPGPSLQAQRRRELVRDVLGIGQPCERDHVDALEKSPQLGGHPQGEPGLADPPDPGQGDQP
jgi:hypothetical protein